MIGASYRRKAPLSDDAQRVLDRLVATRGESGAAKALGISANLVAQLVHGGPGLPATVERVERLLANLKER